MLHIDSISTRIGVTPVHREVVISVGVGETVAILGPNGAGKTSLLRAVMGLLPLQGGRLLLDGEDISRAEPHERNERGIAYVPEGRRIFAPMTVRENLEIGAYGRNPGPAELRASLEAVFDRLPVLREKADAPGGTLSGGQQQMLAIGRALMSKPKLLLLDEPSLGLAPQIVTAVRDLVADLGSRTGMSILIVEQNAGLALSLADRLYLMSRGEIVEEGSPENMAGTESLRALYLGRVETESDESA